MCDLVGDRPKTRIAILNPCGDLFPWESRRKNHVGEHGQQEYDDFCLNRINAKITLVDDCIADAVSFINTQGFSTLNSCCGHGVNDTYFHVYGYVDKIADLWTQLKVRLEPSLLTDRYLFISVSDKFHEDYWPPLKDGRVNFTMRIMSIWKWIEYFQRQCGPDMSFKVHQIDGPSYFAPNLRKSAVVDDRLLQEQT